MNQNANKRLVSVALRLEGEFSQRLLDQLPQDPAVGAFPDARIQRVEAAGSRAVDGGAQFEWDEGFLVPPRELRLFRGRTELGVFSDARTQRFEAAFNSPKPSCRQPLHIEGEPTN